MTRWNKVSAMEPVERAISASKRPHSQLRQLSAVALIVLAWISGTVVFELSATGDQLEHVRFDSGHADSARSAPAVPQLAIAFPSAPSGTTDTGIQQVSAHRGPLEETHVRPALHQTESGAISPVAVSSQPRQH